MKVLLVDDSSTMRKVQITILNKLGYTDIFEACDGQDALNKVSEITPDLILLDWNMPNLNGMGFLQRFRTTDKTTPIIMVTTEAEKSRVLEAIKAGVNNYVLKPFTPDQLKQRIEDTLKKVA